MFLKRSTCSVDESKSLRLLHLEEYLHKNPPFSFYRNSSGSSVYSDLGLDKCTDELRGSATCGDVDWVRSVVEAKEQGFVRLQNELKEAHQELKLKDEEVTRLSRIRQDVEAELEDLTASLFQVNLSLSLYSKLAILHHSALCGLFRWQWYAKIK